MNVQAGWLDAGVLGAVALLGYQYVGFSTVTADGGVVNVYVHLLGFCLGFIVPTARSWRASSTTAPTEGFCQTDTTLRLTE
ncbi:hypothetical protein SY89_01954 [Halolamina pelagica]|uniref:Uncharacterized protein n=1 Tax=Halolamina pelagica TaxID=699431 RepID=A0A0N8I036_9EURY|nr:hypothetical protein [Halolamina pelagica]KPN31211.1 hypothetical protein SY89_01954 [Halolamina pelagica]